MTHKTESESHTEATGHTAVEWVGASASMPVHVTGEGEPYRPAVLVWLDAEGMVLGSTVAKPDELLAVASDSLQDTMELPMHGKPHVPAQVRVASAELAEVLRVGHPGVHVICAPTPEADAIVAEMGEAMSESAAHEPSYLSTGIGPDAMASFFAAAAALYRTRPWALMPDDVSLISVTIESFDVHGAEIYVMGRLGQDFGLIVFPDIDAFEAYFDAAQAIERGEVPEIPPHFSLNYARAAQLAAGSRQEVAEHRWEIAAPDAHPWLVVVDEDRVARPPTAREVSITEAIARALTELLAETTAMRAARDGDEPLVRQLSVSIHQGELDVVMGVRCPQALVEFDPSRDILAELAALARGDEAPDEDAREPLEAELMRRFAAAPEAQDLGELYACRLVMRLAADHCGATLATLEADHLNEVLFEIIPRKISVDASAAHPIIAECRAFYGFLKREFALAQADACLGVLGGEAVDSLAAALSDSRNFGMAKSVVMAGRDAGFDMQSREGMDTWMRTLQERSLPPPIATPGRDTPAPPSRQAKKAKKDKRKAARTARKRNKKNR